MILAEFVTQYTCQAVVGGASRCAVELKGSLEVVGEWCPCCLFSLRSFQLAN